VKIKAENIEEYFANIPEERRDPMNKLRATINKNIPKEFTEMLNYGMPGWVVPFSVYPDGYHCNPKSPVPFINIASQKHFIGFYHMGIYANPELYKWFVNEFPKHCSGKLDMGKSCIRLKNIEEIPYKLLAELCTKMSTQDWIDLYEKNYKRK
jgi:uncharacterized protein YdhG (YjbR/CyaY superfamily)